MKKFFIFFIFVLLLTGCSNSLNNGSVLIETPATLGIDVSKNIAGDVVDISDPNRYRFEVSVESNGKVVNFIQLKRNEEKTLSVPTGIPLTFRVGVYYAEDSDTMYEAYNTYITSETKNDIVVSGGETKELTFDLYVNKDGLVDVYFSDAFGENKVAKINSGAVVGNEVFFSTSPLNTTGISSFNIVEVNGGIINGKTVQNDIKDCIFFDVKNDPLENKIWFLGKGIWSGKDFTNNFTNIQGFETDLSDVKNATGFKIDDKYYYLMDNGKTKFYATGFNLDEDGKWTSIGSVDLSSIPTVYPNEPFLLAAEKDGDSANVMFATRMGLFYVDTDFLKSVAEEGGSQDKVMSGLKKIIKIENPENTKETVLVRRVQSTSDTIYLGTRVGLFKIDKTSGEWSSFLNAGNGSYTVLDNKAISKVSDINETVVSMDEVSKNGGARYLVVSTPKRVWFKELSTGKTAELTVWDGLPFIPLKGFANSDSVSSSDFGTHYIAPVKFVIADSSKFWIGTSFGLASVDIDKLF